MNTTPNYIAEIAKVKLPFDPISTPISKRLFDIIVTLILIIIALPIIFLIIIVFLIEHIFIKESRGSLLYSETRISKGKPFQIYKFRIFKTNSSKNYFLKHGFVQTKELEQNPENLTWLGKILKQIYLDELPQLYNVLIGDMTLVGPRPSNEVVTWQDAQVQKYQRYLFVCGLTGPFQVVKDANNRPEQSLTDMEYILFCKNSPGIKIILKDIYYLYHTVLIIFRAKGV